MAGTLSMMSPGFAMSLVGMGIGAGAASRRRDEFSQSTGEWLPDVAGNEQGYFGDLSKYLPQAQSISKQVQGADFENEMALRESAAPGYREGLAKAGESLWPLLRGEVPSSLMSAFTRAGGASTVGAGMGGSGYGFLNTGLFGARGALGAMQTGYSLLPILLGSMPHLQGSSTLDFLNQGVMNPLQRTNTQMQVRQQNIGIAGALAGMPTGSDMWAQGLTSMGGQIMGADSATVNTAIGSAGSIAKAMG